MPVQVVVGSQWGDEGKGKIIDVLSEKMDLVVRFQGGANAGHTVYIGEQKFVLHLIPSGILRPGVVCIIGEGVVLDPEAFFSELDYLNEAGVDYKNRILVSPRTHIIFPYHKRLDQFTEQDKGAKQIGTTGRGIGPAYSDKYNRIGIRAVDLINERIREQKIRENVAYKNFLFQTYYKGAGMDEDEMQVVGKNYAEAIRPYIRETLDIVHKYRMENKNVLLEGAQGALLDVDYGSYPYVTSSHTLAGGCTIGSGVPPTGIDEVTGVLKVYQTRVGNGPFPTENHGEDGEKLRKLGGEFGATTGRPRRCGWLDLVAARYSIMVNGITNLALTKLDVLDHFDTIYVCTAYKYKGELLESFPADQSCLEEIEPVYEAIKGWKAATSGALTYEELPEGARAYIEHIEQSCDVPVKYVSVGFRRDQIIIRG